jgi:hypothetical protein
VADYRTQYTLFRLVFAVIVLSVVPRVLMFVSGLSVFDPQPKAIEQSLTESAQRGMRPGREVRYECRDGEQGWDYICTEFRTGDCVVRGACSAQQRLGVMEGGYASGRTINFLPTEGFVPSREAYLQKAREEQALRERK